MDRDKYQYKFNLQADNAAAKIVSLIGRDTTVLEVGCGPGSQSRVLRDHLGCRVVGLEIDAGRAALAREFCEQVHVVNVEEASLGDLLGSTRFDAIVCADVLEHLRDPVSVVRRLAPLLKPGGYVLASIPNVTHASVVFEMAHGRFEYQEEGLLDQTHLRFFCRRTALGLFESAGYVVSEIHCVTKLPRNSEFKTTPVGEEDRALLNIIQRENPDSLTYQFVFKAYPTVHAVGATGSAQLVGEQLRRVEHQLSEQQREIARLNSDLAWIESRFLVRAFRKLRTAFRRD